MGFIMRQNLISLAEQTERHARDLESDTLVSMHEGFCNERIAEELRSVSAKLREITKRMEDQ